jgi:predicted DNA-binding transcriptional regulator YafY
MSFSKAVDLLRLAMMACSRRGVCLADVEEEFGCVRRTAQRMIAALQECFPATDHYVGYDGRHYWRLPSRAIAPILTPSADELAAMSTAITELEDAGLAFEAHRVRDIDRKVRALIPPDSSTRLEADEEAMLELMGFATRPGPRPVSNQEVDRAIATALKGPSLLRLSYAGRRDHESTMRTVAPYGLLLGARRYLVARDVRKAGEALRHFRVEDIAEAVVLDESFALPEDFNIAEYAQQAFGSYYNPSDVADVAWRFSPEAADRARRFQFHPTQQLEEEADGSLVVRFRASGQLEMCWHLYAWGDQVEVLAPRSLANLVEGYRRSDFVSLP